MRHRALSMALTLLLAAVTPASWSADPPDAGRDASTATVAYSAFAPPVPFQAYDGGDQYVFAFTRALNHTNAHPVLKMTVLPLAVVLDVVLFPLALLADVMT